jgi:putative ABC transport system permease protein
VTVLVLLAATLAFPAASALRQAPAPALQGRTASEGPGGRRVRQALLAIQLGGVLLLLSLAGVLGMQQRHLLTVDRGFSTHDRLWLGVMTDPGAMPNLDAFVAALERHPAVLHWAFSNNPPAMATQGWIDLNVSASQHKQVLRMSTVSPGFFDTYGMTIVAGAPLVGSGDTAMVIDAKAARALGFATPQSAVGEVLRGGGAFMQEGKDQRRIVAVVKDVKLESARDPAFPQGFILSDKPQWDISIHGRDLASLRQTVEELWKAHGPSNRYELQSADEQRAAVYSQEERMTTMLASIALLSVGVAMLGAYTLIADALRRRRTELVLRRLHGASHTAIVRELANEFALPFVVALVVGLPLAFWFGERYLGGFVDRVDVGSGIVMPMVIASIATLLVTALATLQHVRRALALQAIEAMR